MPLHNISTACLQITFRLSEKEGTAVSKKKVTPLLKKKGGNVFPMTCRSPQEIRTVDNCKKAQSSTFLYRTLIKIKIPRISFLLFLSHPDPLTMKIIIFKLHYFLILSNGTCPLSTPYVRAGYWCLPSQGNFFIELFLLLFTIVVDAIIIIITIISFPSRALRRILDLVCL